jgi:hypothetical protein
MWIHYTAVRRPAPSNATPGGVTAEERVTGLGVFPCLSGSIVAEAAHPA